MDLKIGASQEFYNNRRPHSALGGLSPATYKANLKTKMEAEALTL